MSLKELMITRQESAGKLIKAQEELRDVKDKEKIQQCKNKVEMAQLDFIYWNNMLIEEQEKIIKQKLKLIAIIII